MTFLSTLTMVGASQGFILAVVILSLPFGNLQANRFLAAFIATQSIHLSIMSLVYNPVQPPFALFYLLTISFCFGPLLYFYVRVLVQPQFRFTLPWCLHLLPFPIATMLLALLLQAEQFNQVPYELLPVNLLNVSITIPA